jgi:GT2 family glycosyltransferase
MELSPIELSIIIVNWNGGELLRRCVESIWQHPPRVNHELVVIDNASSDGSADFLRDGNGQVRLIENTQNTGFAKANNQAIRLCHSPWLFLLNPDAEVKAGAIDALLATINSDPRIGACAPKLLNTDGSVQPNVWRLPPTALYIVFENMGLHRLLPGALRGRWLLGRHWHYSRRQPVCAFSGAAMMVRRAMIEAIGAFDESFEMYGEDGEWCVRMARRGWLRYFEPTAEVVHHGGQSALKRWTDDERRLNEIEAHIRFQRCVLPRGRFLLNLLTHAMVLAVIGAWRLVWRQPVKALAAVIRLQLAYCRRELTALFGAAG